MISIHLPNLEVFEIRRNVKFRYLNADEAAIVLAEFASPGRTFLGDYELATPRPDMKLSLRV